MLLSDWLDESHLIESFLESTHNGQTGGGLSNMLFRGSYENWTLMASTRFIIGPIRMLCGRDESLSVLNPTSSAEVPKVVGVVVAAGHHTGPFHGTAR